MADRYDQTVLSVEESSLMVRLLDGHLRMAADHDVLLRLHRKNLVRYGAAGWQLTYRGAVLAVELEEN